MASQQGLPQDLYMSNMLKAVKIRKMAQKDIVRHSSGIIHHFETMHRYTIELFMICHFCVQFQKILQKSLVDRAMQIALESHKKLNACREVKKLIPLKAHGDGNCLMHATSLYMWGVQDTELVLRKTLYNVLRTTDTRNFKFRWQLECVKSMEFTETGLRYDTKNWDEEWDQLVKMASTETSQGQNGLQYNCLEEIHIFVLSNILRRPVIILADNVMRSLESGSSFSPLNVSGIYLPLHWPAKECYKYPVVLGYDSQHFAPLVTMKDSGPEIRAVPLVVSDDENFEDMKVHFLTDHEEKSKEKLIKEYLSVLEIPVQCWENGTTHLIKTARLDEDNLPKELHLVDDFVELVQHEYTRWQETDQNKSRRTRLETLLPQLSLVEVKCETPNCPFYVSVNTQPYCHECYQHNQRVTNRQKQKSESVEHSSEYMVPFEQIVSGESVTGHVSTLATAPSLFLYSETTAMKCKTPDCPFTLNIQLNGLCEHCYKAKHHFPVNAVGMSSSTDIKCNLCFQDTNRTFNGICSACFKRTTEHFTKSSVPLKANETADPVDLSRSLIPLSDLEGGHCDSQECIPSSQSLVLYNIEKKTENRKCRKTGCPFFGTVQNEGFCTLCFYAFQENNASTRRSPKLLPLVNQSSATTFNNLPCCLGRECSSLGSTLFEGYCQKCFLVAQRRHQACSGETEISGQNRRKKHSTSGTQVKLCARNICSNCLICRSDEICDQCRPKPGSHRITVENSPKQRCCAPGCDHYGNNKCKGFCNECFQFKHTYWEGLERTGSNDM
ncbi:TNF alpha induced protein 3 S homeolog isoform X1 [Xenopus laevis]|uniref:ubiquitinyl hydrolase 1 n=2 Tax=Xenopus laevis TaxID=8355 RepID=A0A974CSR8_XENLA|nr:TNF alpha induced protein 3 S homeolog isoform X1 [Xenopus laevis]OCT78000.1 hypothetical protein XELAEV_18029097mg [Xenopus laevis]